MEERRMRRISRREKEGRRKGRKGGQERGLRQTEKRKRGMHAVKYTNRTEGLEAGRMPSRQIQACTQSDSQEG